MRKDQRPVVENEETKNGCAIWKELVSGNRMRTFHIKKYGYRPRVPLNVFSRLLWLFGWIFRLNFYHLCLISGLPFRIHLFTLSGRKVMTLVKPPLVMEHV